MTNRIGPAHPLAPIALTTGIPIALYASDPAYAFDIQRAPDVAGAPGAYATIATDIPGAQQVYVDPLPLDNATRWYRIRHSGLGDTASSFIGPVSSKPVVLPPNIERPAPVLPTYQDALTDDGVTTGTLTVTVADPQFRLTQMEFATQTGMAAKSVYNTVVSSTGIYTKAVTLAEMTTSTVWNRATGYDIDGVSKVLRDRPFTFRDNTTPGPPDVLPTIDDSGNVTARFHGDSKTLAFRWTASDNAIPGSPAAGTVVAGRDAVSGVMVTIALGHFAGIKVVATQNADGSGAQSIVVTKQLQRQNKSTGKTILIHWAWFQPRSEGLGWIRDGTKLYVTDALTNQFYAPIDIPPGATITGLSAELYTAAGADVGQVSLERINGSGGATTNISTVSATGVGGWSTPSSSFSEATGTAPYQLNLIMQAITTGNTGCAFARATLTYTAPDFTVAR